MRYDYNPSISIEDTHTIIKQYDILGYCYSTGIVLGCYFWVKFWFC